MKKYVSIGMMLLLVLSLTHCTYRRAPHVNNDLTVERWQSQVDMSPRQWMPYADRWFYSGEPNAAEMKSRESPDSAAISTMMVRVPDSFTKVKVKGSFQVQIFGSYQHNSLYMLGDNDAVREVNVEIKGDTLYITQTKNAPRHINRVIVRIGMLNLQQLHQMGPGLIEARLIRSDGLCIDSFGCGDVYVSGRVNLKRVNAYDKGTVSVVGAETPMLAVRTNGCGSVNVSGNVGIHSIMHHGSGDVNIVGANTDGLKIYADGKGKIGIQGPANIRSINVRDDVRVYATQVNGDSMYVYATDHACVGLAGCMRYLNIDAGKRSAVQARYLYTMDAYVRAHDAAHINVTASNKLFAAATQNGSVYFYGSPNVMSQFVSGNGTAVPIFLPAMSQEPTTVYCPYYKAAAVYKDAVPIKSGRSYKDKVERHSVSARPRVRVYKGDI